MNVKVLGSGCAKCAKLYEEVKKVAADNKIEAEIVKIDDIMEVMKYNVMATPAIVIDEVVKVKGRVPSSKEILELLQA